MRLDDPTADGIIEDRLDLLRQQEAEVSGQEPIDEDLLASIRAEMERWQEVLGMSATESFFQSLLAATDRQIASLQWTQEGLALLLDIQRRCKDAIEVTS